MNTKCSVSDTHSQNTGTLLFSHCEKGNRATSVSSKYKPGMRMKPTVFPSLFQLTFSSEDQSDKIDWHYNQMKRAKSIELLKCGKSEKCSAQCQC